MLWGSGEWVKVLRMTVNSYPDWTLGPHQVGRQTNLGMTNSLVLFENISLGRSDQVRLTYCFLTFRRLSSLTSFLTTLLKQYFPLFHLGHYGKISSSFSPFPSSLYGISTALNLVGCKLLESLPLIFVMLHSIDLVPISVYFLHLASLTLSTLKV